MRAEAGRLVALLGRLLPWLLPAFLVSLMLSGALARNLALVLMLLGLLAVATPGRCTSPAARGGTRSIIPSSRPGRRRASS